MKLLLVDKREIFLEGLARVLADKPGIEVVGKCLSGSEAIEKASEVRPDVLLIDTELPEGECVETTRSICQILPSTRVLVLTHSEADHDLFSTIRAGARGYISKDIGVDNLIKALTLVARGEVIVSSPVAEKMLAEFFSLKGDHESKPRDIDINLSEREKQVLAMLAKGASNKEIAEALFIAQNTVKVHLRNIMEKLHVRGRLQAAMLAQEKGVSGHTDKESGQVSSST